MSLRGAGKILALGLGSCLALLLTIEQATAQLPQTQLTSLFPIGGRVGSQFELTISGQDLDEVNELVFSHPGISAKPKMTAQQPDKPATAIPREFLVSVANDVPRGLYEVRVRGMFGLSNPRIFAVDSLSEMTESEPNNPREKANLVTLETIVNGRVEAEKSDYFKFELAAGQRVLIECLAFRSDSQLDGTLVLSDESGNELQRSNDVLRRDPMLDFTATTTGIYHVELFDFLYKGGDTYPYRLCISCRPRIDFVFPPQAQPGTKANLTLFGRNLPQGEATELKTLDGKPLQKLAVQVDIPESAAVNATAALQLDPSDLAGECYLYHAKWGEVTANPVPIYLVRDPVILEQEPNNDAAHAQPVAVPCEIAGQFQQRNDQDCYSFTAEKGEVLWLEIISERLGQNTDPYLIVQREVKNAQGEVTSNEVAGVDEAQKPNQQPQQQSLFDLTHADAIHKLVVPETGTYRMLVRDLYYQTRGNPQYVYRLSIRRATPDFRLLAVSEAPKGAQDGNRLNLWSPVLQRGGTQGIRVLLQRQDDFNGQVRVQVIGLPDSIRCPELFLGADSNQGTLTFTAADDAAAWSGTVQIVGHAQLGDQAVTRRAAIGTVVWGSADRTQTPARGRLAGDLALSINTTETQPVTIELGAGTKAETTVAAKYEIPVKITRRGDFKEALKLAAVNLPKDVKLAEVDIPADKLEGKVVLDIKNSVAPGDYSLTLQSSSKINNYRRNPAAVEKAEQAKQALAAQVKQMDEQLKAAQTAKQTAEQAVTNQVATITKLTTALATTKTELQAAEANQKAANEAQTTATQVATEKPDDEELKKALATATQAVTVASQALQATQAKVSAAEAELQAATQTKSNLEQEKSTAESKLTEFTAAKKSLEASQPEVEKRLKEVTEAAKPKTINVVFFSQPIQVKINRSPVEVTLDQPRLTAKAGEKLEFSTKVNRLFGFDDEVRLSVNSNDALGIKVTNLAIPKGQAEGKVNLEIGPKAAPGEQKLTIKVSVTLNNQPVVYDLTLPIQINE